MPVTRGQSSRIADGARTKTNESPAIKALKAQLLDAGGKAATGEDIAKTPLFQLSDTEFIKQLDDAFHDEFEKLAGVTKGATVEKGSSPVIGRYGQDKKGQERDLAPSQLIFGEAKAEVDRTIVGILCMKWLLTNQYDAFTQNQPGVVKLSQADFEDLRTYFIETFGVSSSSYMLIVSMIINDLGKSDTVKGDLFKAAGKPNVKGKKDDEKVAKLKAEVLEAKEMNHDQVIEYAAKLNAIPLLNGFEPEERQQLELGIQFGAKLNCGQLAQAENVPGSLKAIKELMSSKPDAFHFKFLEVILDVAGAQGHVDSTCSKAWISPVHQAYMNARECISQIISGRVTEHDAYGTILEHRAQLLRGKGWKMISIEAGTLDARRNYALLRLITMSRADNEKSAQKTEDVLNSLLTWKSDAPLLDFLNRPIKNVHKALIDGLTVDGVEDGVAIIPYYAPGLLAEVNRVLGKQDESIQRRGVAAFLRLMARAFVGTYSKRGVGASASCVVECDLAFVQHTIHGQDFLINPDILDTVKPEENSYDRDIDACLRKTYGS